MLAIAQEHLASAIAPPSDLLKSERTDVAAGKAALQASLVSAPLGHFLVKAVQKAFSKIEGKGLAGNWAGLFLGQVIVVNFCLAPLQSAGEIHSS